MVSGAEKLDALFLTIEILNVSKIQIWNVLSNIFNVKQLETQINCPS